jgi:hypothetical protein
MLTAAVSERPGAFASVTVTAIEAGINVAWVNRIWTDALFGVGAVT